MTRVTSCGKGRAMNLRHIPLENPWLRLEPLTPEVAPEVARALDCDPETWSILLTPGHGPAFEAWWAATMKEAASGTRMPYAIRRKSDGLVVGTSSFLEIRPEHDAVEIGSTFYHPDARGGLVNPACKLLMMSHAFDSGAHRMQFKVDGRNHRSQAAVAKLGAVREGVLRQNVRTWTGHRRDSVYFSVLADEWPAVRDALQARLAARAFAPKPASEPA